MTWKERMLTEWIPADLKSKNPSLSGKKLTDAVKAEFASWPMVWLRKERNEKLAETDWWASSDLVMTKEQQIYRKSLRDLPSTATPSLDDKGNLLNVAWPTKPD